jgi:hypothetical protein
MKSLTIDPRIEADDRLLSLVDKANRLLESELGPSGDTVSASWQLEDNQGRSQLWLEIEDWAGRVKTKFSLEELASPRQTSARLVRLWGDLLQIRSHRQIETVTQSPDLPISGQVVLDLISDAILDFSERNGREPSVLKLPIRYAIALMKLGASFWGDVFQQIRESGVRSIEGKRLFGVSVELVSGVAAELAVE